MKICAVCGADYNISRPKTCSPTCGRTYELARKKAYRESDPERWSKYNKEYRAKNIAKCRETSARSRDKFMSTVPGRPDKRVNLLIRTCRGSAQQRGLDFELTSETVHAMIIVQGAKCILTGIPFDWGFGGKFRANPFAPSIDRRDSSKGYTYDNIQIVCYIVNLAKNQYPIEMFDRMCIARVEQLSHGQT